MNMKKIASMIMGFCLLVCLLSGCSGAKNEASKVMTDYQNHIVAGDYSDAYALLSDFDKGNIDEEAFTKWQELVAQIITIESFTLDSKVDTFKDYEYKGTKFGTVYGLKVDRVQTVIIPDVELSTYDKETFRVMIQHGDKSDTVLLLVTNLDETIAKYETYISKQQ